MRILRICHSAVVDEYRERERALVRTYGHDVHLVCPHAWYEGGTVVSAAPDAEVPTHVVPVHGRQVPNLFWYDPRALKAIMRELRPEIVDMHEEPYSLAAAGILNALRSSAADAALCFYTAQNLPKRYPPPFSAIEQFVFRRAEAAYPCSAEAAERLRMRGFAGALNVLPLGVSLPPETCRRPGPMRVGFVGRLEHEKGCHIALRAFAAASPASDAELVVIGAGSEEAFLRSEAHSHGLDDRVTFLGGLSQYETLRHMRSLDVVLVPSLTTRTWKEQFGRVPAQAMANGIAVIASDSGSLPEVVGSAGIIVAEGDELGFVSALRRTLLDQALVARLRADGLERARSRLSWEAVAAGMDAMYRSLIGTYPS